MAIPTFKPYGAQGNLAQESGFYGENPWKDPTGGMGQQFLNRKPQMTAQDLMGASQGYASQLGQMGQGWQQFGPNDPRTGQWMKNITGGMQNTMQQNANQQANAGVAAGRGGYGVAGGTPMSSQLARQSTESIAGLYPQLFNQAAGYTKQGVDTANDQLRLLLPMYAQMWGQGLGAAGNLASSIYGTDIGAGTHLMDTAANSYQNWLNQAGGAYGRDVGNYNQALTGDYARQQQQLNDQLARTNAQRQANQGNDINSQLRQVVGDRSSTGMTDANQSVLEYLRQIGAFKSPSMLAAKPLSSATPNAIQGSGFNPGSSSLGYW